MIPLVPFLLGGAAVLVAKSVTKTVAKATISVRRDFGEAVGEAESELDGEADAEFKVALAKHEALKRETANRAG